MPGGDDSYFITAHTTQFCIHKSIEQLRNNMVMIFKSSAYAVTCYNGLYRLKGCYQIAAPVPCQHHNIASNSYTTSSVLQAELCRIPDGRKKKNTSS